MKNNMALTFVLAGMVLFSAGKAKAVMPSGGGTMESISGDAVAARLEARSATLERLSEAVDQLAREGGGAVPASDTVLSGLYSGSTVGAERPVVYTKSAGEFRHYSKHVPVPEENLASSEDTDSDTDTVSDGEEGTPAGSGADNGPAEGTAGSNSELCGWVVLLVLVLLLI